MHALLNNGMQETQTGRVEWPEVDEETVQRLLEWAYSSNYAVYTGTKENLATNRVVGGQSSHTENGSSTNHETPQEVELLINIGWPYESRCRKCSDPKHALIEKFRKFSLPIPSHLKPFVPRQNDNAHEDFTPVLMSHAKLYVLADMYLIGPLKNVACTRLRDQLKEFNLFNIRRQDVNNVASYVCLNTMPGDPMRNMIAHYFACTMEEMIDLEETKELMLQDTDFAFEITRLMANRPALRR